jgi:hypothetical protein
MPVISPEEYEYFLKVELERPKLIAQLATARQEGRDEGLEMAANDINSQSIDGETTEVVLDRAKSIRRIRALKTAPTTGGES